MRVKSFTMKRSSWLFLSCFGFCLFCALVALEASSRDVLAPIFSAFFLLIGFWFILKDRRKELPISDIGIIVALAITCYAVIPPLQFLFSGMEYTKYSAVQLYRLAPSSTDIGYLTWLYVSYLASFIIGYVCFEPAKRSGQIVLAAPRRSLVRAFVIVFFLILFYRYILNIFFDFGFDAIYGSHQMRAGHKAFMAMPVIFRQIYAVLFSNGIFLITKLGLLLIFLLNWQKKFYRQMFFLSFIILLVNAMLHLGSRTNLMLIFMAAIIMFHQFVAPLKPRKLLICGMTLFVLFITIGIMRGHATLGQGIERLKNRQNFEESAFSFATEFQVLYAGNYDLMHMKRSGMIDEVPLQFRLYDIAMIFPRQFLPFEKLDVQKWYKEHSSNPGYFMFSPVSQAIIGFGFLEVFFRGLLLGVILIFFRAWYINHSGNFWATLLYFYLLIISYYMIRGTAIYILLVSIIFRFFPCFVLVSIFQKIDLLIKRNVLGKSN